MARKRTITPRVGTAESAGLGWTSSVATVATVDGIAEDWIERTDS